MRKLWDDLTDVLKAPFVGELDLVHLFLLVGIVMLFAVAWTMILHTVASTVEA